MCTELWRRSVHHGESPGSLMLFFLQHFWPRRVISIHTSNGPAPPHFNCRKNNTIKKKKKRRLTTLYEAPWSYITEHIPQQLCKLWKYCKYDGGRLTKRCWAYCMKYPTHTVLSQTENGLCLIVRRYTITTRRFCFSMVNTDKHCFSNLLHCPAK